MSLSGWTEAIIFSLIIIISAGVIVSSFNDDYNGTNIIPLVSNDTMIAFANYQATSQSAVAGTEAQTTTVTGLSLTQSWQLIKTLMSIIWDVINGQWITTVTGWLHIPLIFGLMFRVLFFMSIIFSLMIILFRVKP